MIRYIDIHTHRAVDGVTSLLSCPAGREPEPGVPFSTGVHPWDAASDDVPAALARLETTGAAAIGEIGLDYAKDVDRALQQDVLRAQLPIAQKRGLPVVLHCVRAYDDMLRILGEYSLKAVIFHSYVGSPQQTARITGKGYYISAGPVSLGSPKTREALRAAPLDRLFAETDDSGARIGDVYASMAVVLGIGEEKLAEAIGHNYKTIFG